MIFTFVKQFLVFGVIGFVYLLIEYCAFCFSCYSQGIRLPEGDGWSSSSNETVIQSCCSIFPFSCSVDWLSPRWCPWFASSSYLYGMIINQYMPVLIISVCHFVACKIITSVTLIIDLCRRQDHYVCSWKESKHPRILWWVWFGEAKNILNCGPFLYVGVTLLLIVSL